MKGQAWGAMAQGCLGEAVAAARGHGHRTSSTSTASVHGHLHREPTRAMHAVGGTPGGPSHVHPHLRKAACDMPHDPLWGPPTHGMKPCRGKSRAECVPSGGAKAGWAGTGAVRDHRFTAQGSRPRLHVGRAGLDGDRRVRSGSETWLSVSQGRACVRVHAVHCGRLSPHDATSCT